MNFLQKIGMFPLMAQHVRTTGCKFGLIIWISDLIWMPTQKKQIPHVYFASEWHIWSLPVRYGSKFSWRFFVPINELPKSPRMLCWLYVRGCINRQFKMSFHACENTSWRFTYPPVYRPPPSTTYDNRPFVLSHTHKTIFNWRLVNASSCTSEYIVQLNILTFYETVID